MPFSCLGLRKSLTDCLDYERGSRLVLNGIVPRAQDIDHHSGPFSKSLRIEAMITQPWAGGRLVIAPVSKYVAIHSLHRQLVAMMKIRICMQKDTYRYMSVGLIDLDGCVNPVHEDPAREEADRTYCGCQHMSTFHIGCRTYRLVRTTRSSAVSSSPYRAVLQ